MPVCPHPQCPCGHKTVTAEVLISHVESSPWAAHTLRNLSMCALGPRTCRICSRVYSTVNALEQHYRDTPVHPKCTRCDIGFADNAAIQAHVISTHRPITCNVCNGLQVYGEDVARHYKISTNHHLNKEAFDEVRQTPHLVAYTQNMRHPQFRCKTCNIPFGSAALLDAHYRESPRHPRCPECQLSFEDNLALVKMSLHDAFSDASIITRSSRSPSLCSFRGPSTRAVTPTRSVASPVPSVQRRFSALTIVNTCCFGCRKAPSVTSQLSPSSISTRTPSFISRSATRAGQSSISLIGVVAASSQRSTPLSPPASISTRSIVAAASYRSDTVSPVSSAQSIFGRAASITSISREQTTTTVPHSDITLTQPVGPGEVSSRKGSLAGSARGRSSSRQSISSDFPKGGPGHGPRTVSRASAQTVSPPPSHVVSPSPGQRERFRIALVNGTSRANSPTKSNSSERFHLPKPEPPHQLSLIEDLRASSLAPGTAVGPEALNTSLQPAATQPTLPPQERFVSHVYCRMCRRDPCRQPAATMCGHIFCHQCISSEVVKTSRCPVCEAR
ncbi:hypothetical protein EDB84DRAFT_1476119, partial [Lactarius hengduanensis]